MSVQDPTISKRSQDLRRRHRESGDKSYLLWLSPATQARLAKLKQEGETLAQLFDRALEALEKNRQDVPPELPGVAKSVANHRLAAQAEELHQQGVSWREIARRWNEKGIATPSGKGQWHGRSVARLVPTE